MNPALHNLLYPHAPYHGSLTPENLLFNANLQEFSQRIEYISNLHISGKLSSDDAMKEIDALWNALSHCKP